MSTLSVSPPRVEHLSEPLGIGVAAPRLSWTTSTDDPAWSQSAYELRLGGAGDGDTRSAEVGGQQQVLVPWPFEPLRSRQRAEVCVRVRGEDGTWSGWSEPTVLEAGLLSAADVVARMISPRGMAGLDDPAPTLAATAQASDGVASARLYITARGLYVAEINGRRVGDQQLAPGWTAYEHRLRYQTYDVTHLIEAGENSLQVTLGNGWFRGNLGRPPRRDLYGDRLGLLAQLEISYTDGSRQVIATDEGWRAFAGTITSDDLYNGQTTDLTRPERGEEHPVDVVDFDPATLVAPEGPPIRVVRELPAAALFHSPSGKRLADFGQNVVGWVRLRAHGLRPGSVVTVRHAEVLESGELGTRPLRTAEATDRYIVGEDAEVTLEPQFTFHGFRYAEIEGVADLAAADLTAVVVSSDLERTGWFECSDPDLNQLHENVVWGMRGNFVGLPTDCPQRDERLGWTGDIQVFAPTASFLFDTAGFLGSWLADLAAEQQPDGSVPYVIPDVFRRPSQAAAAWSDAAAVVPWVLYQRFRDAGILERQFESMCGWVDKMDELAGDDHLWVGGFQYGDWLDPSAPPDSPATVMTSHDVVATAHLAYSAGIVAAVADVLGRSDARARYARLADEAREAFRAHYTTPAGMVLSDSQTAYSMALEWNLLTDDAARARAGDRLADLVRTAGFTIGTGFVGTPLILDALGSAGHPDVAYRLLLQKECPSWLYPITMGATTIWERWDSMLADGTINPGQMTSFNHYAFGAVADWMHRTIAGLAPGEPGYRTIVVRPVLGGALTHASARHLTPYGEVSVSWRRAEGHFSIEVAVPVGCRAEVFLPGQADARMVPAGRHSWTVDDPHSAPAQAGSGSRSAGSLTTREAMDDQAVWDRIVVLAKRFMPGWRPADVAAAVTQYLDRDIREVSRIVGRSTVLPEEAEFAAELEEILRD